MTDDYISEICRHEITGSMIWPKLLCPGILEYGLDPLFVKERHKHCFQCRKDWIEDA